MQQLQCETYAPTHIITTRGNAQSTEKRLRRSTGVTEIIIFQEMVERSLGSEKLVDLHRLHMKVRETN